MTQTPSDLRPGARLAAMRAGAPLVHNITNYVAMNVMANVLLAAGASPAMVHAQEEAPGFAAIASALSVNIGTLSPAWAEAMEASAAAAVAAGKPWVLDPVAVFASPWRTEVCARLVALKPTAIRGNASEILALSGGTAAGSGVDAGDEVASAEAGARALARSSGAVVAVTGPVDLVTDGERTLRVANGHPLMPKVTALGCSLTGVVAAFLASGDDPLADVAAALAYYGLAGEIAAEGARGPGSFAVAFVDALHAITPGDLDARARIEAA
ncbi:hydroxyethylthiazole kinase [Albimonas sp. CAU 1670]|uniref:hydroxyethylthiazole kinase n=1 Tax=Albimonas sp. CAU 1670 TaxID=3032599 RepID=UPI0023DBA2F2|nr:hydroxyethylthiazole kinase [Albimonas sp. CAU 1670]MDF2232917.1 hydroxyethylthiazole kinase [Albimonas sp. CAU 1670]